MTKGKWRALLCFGGGAVCLGLSSAKGEYIPRWWLEPATTVLDLSKPQTNFSPVTTGQLKWMAAQAKLHLDNTLPGGAGSAINNVVNAFVQNQQQNLAPVNLGQLKYVAEVFYVRLNAAGYNTNLNLIANGYSPLWTGSRPWDTNTPESENYRIANSGQLKLVFSFEIVDSNSNGTWDYLEGIYPAWSPTRDTDGDGVPDVEDAYPNDPTRSADLVNNPNDHTAPTITVSQPAGISLLP